MRLSPILQILRPGLLMWLLNVRTSNYFRDEDYQSIFESRVGSKFTLSLPKHKELKPGLLRHLVKAARLTVAEFEGLL